MAGIQETIGRRVQAIRKAKGWTQEQLAERSGLHPTYIGGIERGERNATIASFQKVADSLGVTIAALFRADPHPLEKMFNAPADDIMWAIHNGFRARVDVKGKLAELYLARYFKGLKNQEVIEDFEWNDKDGVPDFVITYKGRRFIVECKNLRSGEAGVYKQKQSYKVEVQKTRNSKDGINTRSYPVDHFHLLAICMFNQTGQWDYFFIATKYLERAADPNLLKIFQAVPFNPTTPWEKDILVVLKDIE
jgi:transcriptional regulator with XRE-family HTH domain